MLAGAATLISTAPRTNFAMPSQLGFARTARVLKQNRGNAGQGVWKVEWVERQPGGAPVVSVLEAQGGSLPEILPLQTFTPRSEGYFPSNGSTIHHPFPPPL